MKDCARLLKSGGLLYVGTCESDGVDMRHLEPHTMRLHQPFHRVIMNECAFHRLAEETGFIVINKFRRSYMDTLRPFCNYRFLDELSKAMGHDMDLMLNPKSVLMVLRNPRLIFFGLFGYFFPSAYEPAMVLRWK